MKLKFNRILISKLFHLNNILHYLKFIHNKLNMKKYIFYN